MINTSTACTKAATSFNSTGHLRVAYETGLHTGSNTSQFSLHELTRSIHTNERKSKKKKLWKSPGESFFLISNGEILLGVNREVRNFDDNQQKVD